ncbi:MAG TPA: histidine kinase dimerization/phospho-acceptor domain-containing protein [Candidatus Dormibacteraeota bacterium]|nr:histidine kinase dimerization/phospho-acceptor domain-containing protein [Candidatus Dormibacteraeota bacterium]
MDQHDQREFLLRTAHDIRSPITTIGGFAELLEASLVEGDERHAYLAAIQRAVARLSDLAERLLARAAEGGP